MAEQNQEYFYGEETCQERYQSAKPCKNKAYMQDTVTHRLICKLHAKKYTSTKPLRSNPNAREKYLQRLKEHEKTVEQARLINQEQKKCGQLIGTKLYMMKAPEDVVGFMKVFPNYLHQHRIDGFGCASLSPKSMGPIKHPQPDLPAALNLENFWQFSKVFSDEVDVKGEPLPIFFERQKNGFLDPIPHRHKPNATGNIPLYSVWKRPDGSLIKYKYIQARQIYCYYYEQFALKDPNFHKLKQMLQDGFNLQICGYDAYQPTESWETHYLDASRPFGHELVLMTLLLVENPQEYPWRKYQTEMFSVSS